MIKNMSKPRTASSDNNREFAETLFAMGILFLKKPVLQCSRAGQRGQCAGHVIPALLEEREDCPDFVKVEPVGVNDKGEMDTIPRYDSAGWYMYGACPNQVGNCIIAGHNRYGGQKGLFAILHNGMKEGDRVSVTMENGETIFYRVVSLNRYRYDSVPAEVMAPSPDQRLTLITCLGDYDWDLHMSKTRVVAVCEPVDEQ